MAEIDTVGIVGTGVMGAGLAELVATAGYRVVARSRRRDGALAVADTVAASLQRQVGRGTLTAGERDEVIARVTATDDLADLGGCDLVIESIVEELPAKRTLFAELDEVVKPSAILATNTSTLP